MIYVVRAGVEALLMRFFPPRLAEESNTTGRFPASGIASGANNRGPGHARQVQIQEGSESKRLLLAKFRDSGLPWRRVCTAKVFLLQPGLEEFPPRDVSAFSRQEGAWVAHSGTNFWKGVKPSLRWAERNCQLTLSKTLAIDYCRNWGC